MYKIQIQGKILELDDQDFLSLLNKISKTVHWLARLACEDHRVGSINANGSQQIDQLMIKDEWHEALLRAAGDFDLEKLFNELLLSKEKIRQQDRRMIEWLATYYDISTLNSPEGRKKLNRSLTRARQKAAGSKSGILPWTNETEWRKLETDYLQTVSEIGGIVSKITLRLKLLGMKTND